MKFLFLLFLISLCSIIGQKWLMTKYEPSLDNFRQTEIIKGQYERKRSGRFPYVAIAGKNVVCEVGFFGGGVDCSLEKIKDNDNVEANVSKIRTLFGEALYVSYISLNGEIIFSNTPAQSYQHWYASSKRQIYINTFLLLFVFWLLWVIFSVLCKKSD